MKPEILCILFISALHLSLPGQKVDQELINGIHFSNQYAKIDGNPYFMDGRFHNGDVSVHGRVYTGIPLRYNLYSQNVEIEYHSSEGFRNQLITVPEWMPSFTLAGIRFRRMEIPGETPAYYQVVRQGTAMAYVGWSKSKVPSNNQSSKPDEFSKVSRIFWFRHAGTWYAFTDRKSYLKMFPAERKKEAIQILKELRFSFRECTPREAEILMKSTLEQLGMP